MLIRSTYIIMYMLKVGTDLYAAATFAEMAGVISRCK